MFMAILFVTVFVVEAETAVDANAFPVTAGSVSVKLEAVVGSWRVTEPPPEELSFTDIRHYLANSPNNSFAKDCLQAYAESKSKKPQRL